MGKQKDKNETQAMDFKLLRSIIEKIYVYKKRQFGIRQSEVK
jgi:hypothetical protein